MEASNNKRKKPDGGYHIGGSSASKWLEIKQKLDTLCTTLDKLYEHLQDEVAIDEILIGLRNLVRQATLHAVNSDPNSIEGSPGPALEKSNDEIMNSNGQESKTVPSSKGALAQGHQPPDPYENTTIGEHSRYKVQRKLGGGSYGKVYKAHDTELDRIVALKILNDGSNIEALKKEATMIAQANHPSIVTIYDFFIHENHSWISMEYVTDTLFSYLQRRQPISITEVILILVQILDGLELLHSKNIVHGDLAARNVAVEIDKLKQPRLKLLDFGLAGFDGSHRSDKRSKRSDLDQFRQLFKTHFEQLVPKDIISFMNFDTATTTASALKQQLLRIQYASPEVPKPEWFHWPKIIEAYYPGFEPNNLICKWSTSSNDGNPEAPMVSPRYLNQYLSIQEKIEAEMKLRDNWNGRIMAIRRARSSRLPHGDEEIPQLHLTLAKVRYKHHLSMQRIFRSLPQSEKDKIVEQTDAEWLEFGTALGVHVGIITPDNHLIFTRRSKKVEGAVGQFICGFTETMAWEDVDDNGDPDPYKTVIRGLREELFTGPLDAQEIRRCTKITALCIRESDFIWGLQCFIDLRQLDQRLFSSSGFKLESFLKRPKDSFETNEVKAIPLDPKAVIHFIKDHDLTPGATLCTMQILNACCPNEKVLNEVWELFANPSTNLYNFSPMIQPAATSASSMDQIERNISSPDQSLSTPLHPSAALLAEWVSYFNLRKGLSSSVYHDFVVFVSQLEKDEGNLLATVKERFPEWNWNGDNGGFNSEVTFEQVTSRLESIIYYY